MRVLWSALCDLVILSNIRKKSHSATRHYTNPAVRLKSAQPAPKCPEYVYSKFSYLLLLVYRGLMYPVAVLEVAMVVFIMPTRYYAERIQFGSPNLSGENDGLW